MALRRRNISEILFVLLIFVLLVKSNLGSKTSGIGERPKYISNAEETKHINNVGKQDRPLLGQGQLCPNNSPRGCRCWSRPNDFQNNIIFINCTGTGKEVLPQV